MPRRKRTKEEISAARKRAGSKGGSAPHTRWGLEGLKRKRRLEISRQGTAARWGGK